MYRRLPGTPGIVKVIKRRARNGWNLEIIAWKIADLGASCRVDVVFFYPSLPASPHLIRPPFLVPSSLRRSRCRLRKGCPSNCLKVTLYHNFGISGSSSIWCTNYMNIMILRKCPGFVVINVMGIVASFFSVVPSPVRSGLPRARGVM